MKKLLLACLVMALTSAAFVGGCRVGGEIDPDGDVSYNGGVAR